MPEDQPPEQVSQPAGAELMRVSVDLDSYTLREKLELERSLGEPLGVLFPGRGVIPYRALVGLAWLTRRRQHQRGTVGHDNLTFEAFVDSGDEAWTGVSPDPPAPGGPAAEPASSPPSSTTGAD